MVDYSGIKKFLSSCPDEITFHTGPNYFKLFWSEPGTGFGEITFVKKEDGSIELDTETMSIEFVEKQFKKLIEKAKVEKY